jgi:hypothetical protein
LHSVDSLKHTAEEVIQQQLPLASLQSDSRSSVTDTCGADYGSSGAGSGVGVSSGAGISSGSSGGSSGAGSGDRAADGYAARLPVAKHLKQHMHDVGHDLREVLLPFAQGLAGVFEEHAAFSLPSFADFVFGLEVVGQGLCRAGLPSNSCCSNYVCDNLGTASAMFGLVRGKACVCGACVAASCSSDVDGGSSSASTSGSGGSTAGGLPGRPTPRLLVPARCALWCYECYPTQPCCQVVTDWQQHHICVSNECSASSTVTVCLCWGAASRPVQCLATTDQAAASSCCPAAAPGCDRYCSRECQREDGDHH